MHRDPLHVARAQRSSPVQESALYDGRMADEVIAVPHQRVHPAQSVLPVMLGQICAEYHVKQRPSL